MTCLTSSYSSIAARVETDHDAHGSSFVFAETTSKFSPGCDTSMNVHLKNVTMVVKHRPVVKMEHLTVRGPSIRYVVLPDGLDLDKKLLDDRRSGFFGNGVIDLVFFGKGVLNLVLDRRRKICRCRGYIWVLLVLSSSSGVVTVEAEDDDFVVRSRRSAMSSTDVDRHVQYSRTQKHLCIWLFVTDL